MKKKSNFLGKKVGEAVAEKGRQKDGKSEDEVQFPAKKPRIISVAKIVANFDSGFWAFPKC